MQGEYDPGMWHDENALCMDGGVENVTHISS